MQTVYIGNTLVNDVMLGSQRMDDVVQYISPGYVTNTATLILDAGNPTSYIGTGTNWNNIATGFNTTASIENGLQTTYTAVSGGYFTFPYTSSYLVNVGGVWSSAVSFAGNFSFNIWFTINNFRTGTDDNVGLLVKDTFTSNPGFGILINRDTNTANRGAVAFYANDTPISFPTKATLTSGKWSNLQITRSGSVITAYFDGVSLGTGSNSSNLNDATKNMTFGRAAVSTYRFEGSLSFIGAYSSSLSAGQVLQNYDALKIRYA